MGVWDVFSKSFFHLIVFSLIVSGCASEFSPAGSADSNSDWSLEDKFGNGGTFVGNSPGSMVMTRAGDFITCHFYPAEGTPPESWPLGIELYGLTTIEQWIFLSRQVGAAVSFNAADYPSFATFECRPYGGSVGPLQPVGQQKCAAADLDQDQAITGADLAIINSYFSFGDSRGDINQDQFVDQFDVAIVLNCLGVDLSGQGGAL